jgi:hypothetical protein
MVSMGDGVFDDDKARVWHASGRVTGVFRNENDFG